MIKTRFKMSDDRDRHAIVDNADDAIVWMLGKSGIEVEVISHDTDDDDDVFALSGFSKIKTVGKVS